MLRRILFVGLALATVVVPNGCHTKSYRVTRPAVVQSVPIATQAPCCPNNGAVPQTAVQVPGPPPLQ